jgi:Cys-tRNA synthase (O-phospho-L-seryl-tRNA:Cys-tRNA synthase)
MPVFIDLERLKITMDLLPKADYNSYSFEWRPYKAVLDNHQSEDKSLDESDKFEFRDYSRA